MLLRGVKVCGMGIAWVLGGVKGAEVCGADLCGNEVLLDQKSCSSLLFPVFHQERNEPSFLLAFTCLYLEETNLQNSCRLLLI